MWTLWPLNHPTQRKKKEKDSVYHLSVQHCSANLRKPTRHFIYTYMHIYIHIYSNQKKILVESTDQFLELTREFGKTFGHKIKLQTWKESLYAIKNQLDKILIIPFTIAAQCESPSRRQGKQKVYQGKGCGHKRRSSHLTLGSQALKDGTLRMCMHTAALFITQAWKRRNAHVVNEQTKDRPSLQ